MFFIQYLRQKKYSVYFLQDTHFSSKIEQQIRAEWGYECIFSSNNSRSRGVAILLNNNFDFKIEKTIKDSQGNYIILVMKTMGKQITLINIYGPNKDDPKFFNDIQNKIQELSSTNIIMAGDWNLVLNPNLDYDNYKRINNIKARDTVLEMTTELELADIWREYNPEVQRYTWRRPNPFQQSRLDFFLVWKHFSIL